MSPLTVLPSTFAFQTITLFDFTFYDKDPIVLSRNVKFVCDHLYRILKSILTEHRTSSVFTKMYIGSWFTTRMYSLVNVKALNSSTIVRVNGGQKCNQELTILI